MYPIRQHPRQSICTQLQQVGFGAVKAGESVPAVMHPVHVEKN
jgi:hypothetical protein